MGQLGMHGMGRPTKNKPKKKANCGTIQKVWFQLYYKTGEFCIYPHIIYRKKFGRVNTRQNDGWLPMGCKMEFSSLLCMFWHCLKLLNWVYLYILFGYGKEIQSVVCKHFPVIPVLWCLVRENWKNNWTLFNCVCCLIALFFLAKGNCD